MCGLVAIWERKRPASMKQLDNAISELSHRGPDATASWQNKEGNVGLAHARLAIIGGETGVQPMSNEDESITVTVNGEFYGFETIREKLAAAGYTFKTSSDSEILIHLYAKYGIECVHHLRGEFAFVLWDERRRLLIAGRDRFGIKPLYYNLTNDHFYATSEAKALFRLGVPREWNYDVALKNDHLFAVRPHETFFKNIAQVKPGELLIISDQGIDHHKYWSLPFPNRNDNSARSEREQIGRYRYLLRDAVRQRLRSDAPVGFYLSGGLDSSAIFGLASEMSEKQLHAYSIGFKGYPYDESEIAREMADLHGANLTTVYVDDQMLADHFCETVWHCEAPMFNTHSVAKYILSQKVQESGLKVVMTGEGSDDLLSGYAFLRKDIMSDHYGESVKGKQMVQSLLGSNRIYGSLFNTDRDKSLGAVEKCLGYTPCFLQTGANYQSSISSLYSEEYKEYSLNQDIHKELMEGLKGPASTYRSSTLSTQIWVNSHLPSYILSIVGDRVEMANSVEGRLPFLDHHLAEYTVTLPDELKLRGSTDKYILREAVKELLPEIVYQRQKQPFLAPPACGGSTRFTEMIGDLIHGEAMRNLPFYDDKKVAKFFSAMNNAKYDDQLHADKVILQIASLCVMQERYALS